MTDTTPNLTIAQALDMAVSALNAQALCLEADQMEGNDWVKPGTIATTYKAAEKLAELKKMLEAAG